MTRETKWSETTLSLLAVCLLTGPLRLVEVRRNGNVVLCPGSDDGAGVVEVVLANLPTSEALEMAEALEAAMAGGK
jgi:hypothetical protein